MTALASGLVIVQEIGRDAVDDWDDVADRIVGAVAGEQGTPPDAVVFVPRGSIPRTTSGKIRRSECRSQYGRGELVEVHRHETGRSSMTRDRALAAFVVIAPAIAVVAAVMLSAFGIGPSVTDLVVLAVGTLATMAGVELGFHRYFAHRAFTAAPALVWLLGALGSSAFLGPVMWWVTTHRRHHSVTDREGDPHSPHWPYSGTRGFLHAHAGWLFRPEYTGMTVTAGEVKDLWQSPRTIALHRTLSGVGRAGIGDPGADRLRRGWRARRAHRLPVGRHGAGIPGESRCVGGEFVRSSARGTRPAAALR